MKNHVSSGVIQIRDTTGRYWFANAGSISEFDEKLKKRVSIPVHVLREEVGDAEKSVHLCTSHVVYFWPAAEQEVNTDGG